MTIEIRTKALELAVEFSKGYNRDLDNYHLKCNSDSVVDIANKFEKYMKGY